MGKLKVIVSAIVAIGLVSILAWQHFANESLREDNDGLKQSLAALKQLSDISTPVIVEETMGEEQQAELLKLRAEVTQLRTETNQIAVLAEANQKLKSSLKEARTPVQAEVSTKKKPEDALPQDIHPQATWAFRGYGTPDATVESVLSGMVNGDKAAVLAGFSPEMAANIDGQFDKAVEQAKSDDKAEFRVLDRKPISDDQMVLTLYLVTKKSNGDTEEHSEDTVFQRIGGEWKVTDKPAPNN
jgi:hypothetical protein